MLLLVDADKFWAEAAMTTTYLQKPLQGQARLPLSLWHGRVPSLVNL